MNNTFHVPELFEMEAPVSESSEQGGAGRSVYQGNCVNEGRIKTLLSQIPASCAYPEWFKVACALKHEGLDYEVFRAWSAGSSEKYSESAC